MAAPPVQYVPAVNPETGAVENIHPEDVGLAQQQGWRMPSQEEWAAFQKAQAFGSRGQQAAAFAEGVGEGLLGPVIPAVERGLGVPAEDILARKEANPGAATAGQVVGFAAPLVATLGASAPVQGGIASARTLPGLATKLGAAAAARVAPAAGAGVLRRAVPAAVDFATQGALLAGSNVATQAVLGDPKLSAESAVAEVALGAGLGGVLGFGGSAAAHGLASLLGKAGEKALSVAASKAENPETFKLLASWKTDPAVREAVFKLDKAGISPNVIAPAHPETAKLLLGNAERVTALEAKYPGLAEDVLSKATPEEAALILRDGDKIILGTTARNTIGEELAATTSAAFNSTDDALSAALKGARSAEVERLIGGSGPAAEEVATSLGPVNLHYSVEGSTPTVRAVAPDGRTVGIAEFVTEGTEKGTMRGGHVRVADEARRQGLASAMYDLASAKSGNRILPSGYQTEMGEKFVASYSGRAAGVSPVAAQGQLGEVFDEVSSLAAKMRAETDLYNQGAARKLELLAEGLARDSGEGPVETFRRLNQAKRQLDDLASWGRKPANNINEDTVHAIRDLRAKVRQGLESEAVWGEAGARQKDLNKALSEYWTAQEIAAKGPKGDPRRGFMVEVQQPDGSFVWEARPTRINEWLNAMADARGGAKSEGFTNYLEAATKLADQMEKSGYEGAAALREQLTAIRNGFQETERQAAVTQTVNRLKNPDAILTSKGYIPTPKQLAGEAASSLVGSIPIVGPLAGTIEGALTRVRQPSFAIGVMDAFGKATQKMSESIASGVGRVVSGTAAKGTAEVADALTAKNYTKVANEIRSHAADPNMLADANARRTGPWSEHAPDAALEAVGISARATQHLASKLPQEPELGPFGGTYKPSPAELAPFNRAARIAQNPASILDDIRRGTIHPDHVEALATIYPALHKEMTVQIMDRLAAAGATGQRIPFKVRMGLALFLGGNMDPMLQPAAMQANQAALAVSSQNEQTGNVEPSSRSLDALGVAGRMSTPMQASAYRSA